MRRPPIRVILGQGKGSFETNVCTDHCIHHMKAYLDGTALKRESAGAASDFDVQLARAERDAEASAGRARFSRQRSSSYILAPVADPPDDTSAAPDDLQSGNVSAESPDQDDGCWCCGLRGRKSSEREDPEWERKGLMAGEQPPENRSPTQTDAT